MISEVVDGKTVCGVSFSPDASDDVCSFQPTILSTQPSALPKSRNQRRPQGVCDLDNLSYLTSKCQRLRKIPAQQGLEARDTGEDRKKGKSSKK